VIPAAANSNVTSAEASPKLNTGAAHTSSSPVPTSMKPPAPPSHKSVQSSLSNAGIQPLGQAPPKIAPMPGNKVLSNNEGAASSSITVMFDGKKQIKRAANRRSAQLSRKRKKQFIEELKEENDELRRKEQILMSIPDLIVVFDSSGKLGFVSQSVARFIDMTPEELEGTSFWDRLCEDSVRLLKAAFMDSLAARKPDSDTASLGEGVWELRLVDKDSNYNIVTLNGVVHFSGEAPECVCCIRPRDQRQIQRLSKEIKKPTVRAVSSSDGSRSSDSSRRDSLEIRANPNQSVISNDMNDTTSADDSGTNSESRKKPRRQAAVVRVSDGDSAEISSGSDDGVVSN
jgi:PAS domain-containing protein